MNDEEVIRRRLLIDGDGTGDDRRLNALLKSFVKWCSSDEPEAEWRSGQDRMLAHLAQCDFALAKARLTSTMSAEELENYQTWAKQIEVDIARAKSQIEKTKADLKNARTIRRNKIEYDLLAVVINQQPDRRKTNEELKQLHEDLSALQATREELEKKLDMRRKQFSVMFSSVYQLQALLNESDDEMMDVSLDDMDTAAPEGLSSSSS
ncbi:THO complex subunit 7-like protein [Frankliniella fusca]|uniref:THO complex subunit 7-like protein n=1 Tax=Frankliniella fusca TaxID=407009 RepID=A0AAE1LNS1_9NEOP|nr:THO complex subunit 7-like protein [Frankliniella fusca]